MEALLTTFVTAFAAEWGDKTQLLAAALAARYRKPGLVLAGVAIAAIANAAIAGGAGGVLSGMVTLRALSLLVALALLAAALSALTRAKLPDMGRITTMGAFAGTGAAFFLLEFGDKTQFTTAALSARFHAPALGAAGSAAGVIAASLPAVLLGDRLVKTVPLRAIRWSVAAMFLVAAFVVGVNALRLT